MVKEYPIIKDIMKSIGFESITNPVMLSTVGKFMTLKKGANAKNIDIKTIQDKFLENNFILEDNNE